MRKIILNIAVSIDGFIEGPNGEFDWCLTDQDYGMSDFMNGIDTIFFGRKSYELMLTMNENPFPDKIKYVFSKAKRKTKSNIQFINQDIEKRARRIKNQKGMDIWLFGGAKLITTFMNYGLVDELQLAIHPLLLGQGKSLFEGIKKRIALNLTDSKTYSSGLVQLFYTVVYK